MTERLSRDEVRKLVASVTGPIYAALDRAERLARQQNDEDTLSTLDFIDEGRKQLARGAELIESGGYYANRATERVEVNR